MVETEVVEMTALLTRRTVHFELVEDAVRAPSSHNTQPWLFRLVDGAVELHADRTRALPVNDPRDRELVISCGAALTNLCVSAAHHHLAATVHAKPDDEDDDHLATVHLEPQPTYTDARLAYGIRSRGTWRSAFAPRPVAPALVDELRAAAEQDGVWTRVVQGDARTELVGLVVGGDHYQFEDPSWRRELASWLHPRRTGDGLAVPAVTGAVTRYVVSHADVGERAARQDADLTASAPFVVVLGTDRDDEAAWLAAGQALDRLLLTAAVRGLQAGFSNQPCQVAVLRPGLASLVGGAHPQVVLRIGYPTEPPLPSVRRPVESVLID